MNPSSSDLPDFEGPSDASEPRAPASASSANCVAAVDAEAPPPSGERRRRVVDALRRFIASKAPDEGRSFVRGVVIHHLHGPKPKNIAPTLVDDRTASSARARPRGSIAALHAAGHPGMGRASHRRSPSTPAQRLGRAGHLFV